MQGQLSLMYSPTAGIADPALCNIPAIPSQLSSKMMHSYSSGLVAESLFCRSSGLSSAVGAPVPSLKAKCKYRAMAFPALSSASACSNAEYLFQLNSALSRTIPLIA